MLAQWPQKAPRTTADIQSSAALRSGVRGKPLQFAHKTSDDIYRSGKKLFLVLISTAESGIVVNILPGAPVPVQAHPLKALTVGHFAGTIADVAVEFREVSLAPIRELTVAAPDSAVVGVIGEQGAGKGTLLQLAAGLKTPASGRVSVDDPRRWLGPADSLDLSPARTLLLEHTLAQHDALVRAKAALSLERLRRGGTTILLVSHEEELLRALCDEIWWLRDGALAGKGNPAEVLELYRRDIAQRLRSGGESVSAPICPSLRRGDGRARVLNVETLGRDGRSTMVWSSGEPVSVRVTVRFEQAVDDPVIGIMIRTRIGMEVFGTNTLLENLPLGPCSAGATLRAAFSFDCALCPQEYTLTVASHDRDGIWHDWLEDAIAFLVTDARYTAGVANLRARVTCERL